jgi:predicted Zn-dependent peptidase
MARLRFAAFAVLAAAVLLAPRAGAQVQAPPAPDAPSTRGVVPKGKAPVSDEVLRIKLPRPREAMLANGLRLMVLEDRRVPQVTFTMLVPGAGGYDEPAALRGLASFTAAMMREGTATRSSAQISEQLETMSAALNVGAGMSSVDATVNGSSLTEHFDRLMELTADVLLHPAFADDELTRYKQRTNAQLVQQRAIPGFLVNERYARVMYGSHPAGEIAPSAEALQKVTRADLVGFHQARYVPDHAVLAIAGDVSLEEARKIVEAKLGGWKKAGAQAPRVSDPSLAPNRAVHLVTRPNSVQTSFIVGAPAIARTDPSYDIAMVMNRIIGGGPTGRLFITLREDKGYTYGASSGLSAGLFRGDWRASTDVRAPVTEAALADLLAEIDRLRTERVPDAEFRDAKRAMVASFALSLESPQQMLSYYITSWVYKLPPDYWDRYPERINAVTQDQVQAAARQYLDPARLQIVAVGDAGIADVLRKHGELTVYDSDGRRAGTQ